MRTAYFDFKIEYKGDIYNCLGFFHYEGESKGIIKGNFEIAELNTTDKDGYKPDKEIRDALFELVRKKIGEDYFDWAYQE